MKANREKFKQFVIEQLKDYDEWREASPDGYAEIITDEAVKLFYQPAVVGRSEQLESGLTCMMCRKPKQNDGHTCCEECAGLAF